MSATELQFRTSTLGGFHKQDVLTYIETSSRTHSEKVEQLNREIKAVTDEKAEAEKEGTNLLCRVTELTEEKSQMAKDLAEKEAELEALRATLKEKEDDILSIEGENEALKTRLEKAEPNADLYECIKNRTAGVELEALRRAQEIENNANVHATKTRDELEQWMKNVQKGYKALREDMDKTISKAKKELEDACATIELIPEEFITGDETLEELLDKSSPVVKMPMPLEE